MSIEQLPIKEHELLKRLARVGPQHSFYDDASAGLREKGLAKLDPETNMLVATEKGMAIGRERVMRKA